MTAIQLLARVDLADGTQATCRYKQLEFCTMMKRKARAERNVALLHRAVQLEALFVARSWNSTTPAGKTPDSDRSG